MVDTKYRKERSFQANPSIVLLVRINSYIMKVADFLAFLKHNWGAPDRELIMSEANYINGKKGVIIMEINGWSDATGHATLWNGSATGDNSDYHRSDSHTYDRPDVKLEKINFWELKG